MTPISSAFMLSIGATSLHNTTWTSQWAHNLCWIGPSRRSPSMLRSRRPRAPLSPPLLPSQSHFPPLSPARIPAFTAVTIPSLLNCFSLPLSMSLTDLPCPSLRKVPSEIIRKPDPYSIRHFSCFQSPLLRSIHFQKARKTPKDGRINPFTFLAVRVRHADCPRVAIAWRIMPWT